MRKSRIKIPKKVSDDVLYKSDLLCVICQDPGKQIHHIDENPANCDFDNLVLLCYDHHEQVSVKGGTSKKISPTLLKRYRNEHYRKIAQKRKLDWPKRDLKVHKELSHDVIYSLCRDALISIEVGKFNMEIDKREWNSMEDQIFSLMRFPYDTGFRGRKVILEALVEVSYNTRFEMPLNIAKAIEHVAYHYVPINSLHIVSNKKISAEEVELWRVASEIGRSISYDAIKYLQDSKIPIQGIVLLWKLLRYARINKVKEVVEYVVSTLDDLKGLAEHKKDLVEIIQIFKEQGLSNETSFPIIPKHLEELFKA